jgi:hypothetical protein
MYRLETRLAAALLAGLIAGTFSIAARDSYAAAGGALAYATYLRPTALAAGDGFQNHGLAVTADADGNAYVAGIVESASFPVTAGAYRTTRPGGTDVFVASSR